MNGWDLLDRFRALAMDSATPHLWSDEFVLSALNEGEREAAERSLLIYDESTVAVTQVAVTAGISTYTASNLIVSIEQGTFTGASGKTERLSIYDRAKLDHRTAAVRAEDEEWFGTLPGPPTGLIYDGKTLETNREPSESGIITLGVYRLPIKPFTESDEPEIAPALHADLVEWALFRAFTVPDADGKNTDLATVHLNLFEQRFGKRPAAGEIIRQRAIKPRYGTKCWW